jgi:hypothetical protein
VLANSILGVTIVQVWTPSFRASQTVHPGTLRTHDVDAHLVGAALGAKLWRITIRERKAWLVFATFAPTVLDVVCTHGLAVLAELRLSLHESECGFLLVASNTHSRVAIEPHGLVAKKLLGAFAAVPRLLRRLQVPEALAFIAPLAPFGNDVDHIASALGRTSTTVQWWLSLVVEVALVLVAVDAEAGFFEQTHARVFSAMWCASHLLATRYAPGHSRLAAVDLASSRLDVLEVQMATLVASGTCDCFSIHLAISRVANIAVLTLLCHL